VTFNCSNNTIETVLEHNAMSLFRCYKLTLVMLASIALTGCASYQAIETTAIDEQLNLPDSFSLTGQGTALDKGWLAFEDAQLNLLIEQALAENFSLRSSFSRVKKAQAIKKQVNSQRGINVSAALQSSIFDRRADNSNDSNSQYTGALSASYEVDLWGELEAAYDAADFDYIASQQDYRAAAISLSAEVATTWYELLAAEKSLVVYRQQLAVNESILILAQEQFINGVTTISDSTQQAAQVASSKAALANQKAIVDALRHSLNVLLGNNVNKPLATEVAQLPSLPPLPATGIPSAVLTKRPDIYSQWLEVQSTQQDVAQAIAARYPSLSIGLTTESIVTSAADLFSNWTTSLLASLVVDLWTGGKNAALVEEKRAAVEEAVNDYSQLLLEAIKETEDALSNERYIKQRLEHLRQQRELTYQALDQLKTYYINGSSTFTELLNSLTSAQSLDIDVIEVNQRLIANRISLYRTLSAGWEMPVHMN